MTDFWFLKWLCKYCGICEYLNLSLIAKLSSNVALLIYTCPNTVTLDISCCSSRCTPYFFPSVPTPACFVLWEADLGGKVPWLLPYGSAGLMRDWQEMRRKEESSVEVCFSWLCLQGWWAVAASLDPVSQFLVIEPVCSTLSLCL